MYKCDFCDVQIESLETGWTYKTKPFATLMVGEISLGIVDDGEWLACDACASLIERKDKVELENRAVKIFMKSLKGVNEAQVRSAIHTSHNGFWKHKKEEKQSV